MNNTYRTVVETGHADSGWDDFLSSLDCSHHEQSTCWAEVKAYQGWSALRIKVLKGAEWLAGAQMLCKRLPFGGSVGYVSSGPFYQSPDDEALDALLGSINTVARERNIHYVAITPYAENPYLDSLFRKNGYGPTREMLPPTSTTRATLLLDLSRGEKELLMDMRRETRREIKLALKSGIVVREGTREDLGTLFSLMSIVAKRRGEHPVPSHVSVFERIWDHFYPKGYVNLLLVELEGKIISIGIIFTFGKTVRFWKYGWSGEEDRKYPNQLLYWALIKWSLEKGFRSFDIVQVDSVVTDHLSRGLPVTEELKSRRLYGPTLFKLGFGGRVEKFSGPWFRFANPLVRNLYPYIGPSLMKLPPTKRLIARL